jgi:hypothetical protein
MVTHFGDDGEHKLVTHGEHTFCDQVKEPTGGPVPMHYELLLEIFRWRFARYARYARSAEARA